MGPEYYDIGVGQLPKITNQVLIEDNQICDQVMQLFLQCLVRRRDIGLILCCNI